MAELSRCTKIVTFSVPERTITHTHISDGLFEVRQRIRTIVAQTEGGAFLKEKGDVLDDLSASFSLGAELQTQSECGSVVDNFAFNDGLCESGEGGVDDSGSGP